jgi:dCTP deaminase
MVHLTAPTIHAGFDGFITLEVINHGPFDLKLVPHKTVMCQYIFERLEQAPGKKITTAFQGQTTPTGGRPKARSR